MFIGSNQGVEGIYASGTAVCFNVGWHGRFIPCFYENPAKSLLDESGYALWL
jgi:hypothetical protein